ncbi:hypothetical protein [Marinobacter persicus]|uniref:Uncharacterized protein n=1 Tax=Marinobacter persicus TaxID=930118 RepID=A0A2S6G2E8_9GAMM|nr:hypothetical protein [Marinobacter persicus]PPK49955.1 hypothetical protein BY455_1402 [Marinobacter persicus]PPK51872.1 hypothetical protein B0H24_10402 [Marinobacter persicus]PPK56539.1 hypothetical protein BY454_1402 [Marinobacter persicus]
MAARWQSIMMQTCYRREIKFDQKGKLFRLIREQQKIKFDPISGGRLTTGHFSLK